MTEGRTNTWLSGCGRCLLLTWEMASVILARTFWKVVRTFFNLEPAGALLVKLVALTAWQPGWWVYRRLRAPCLLCSQDAPQINFKESGGSSSATVENCGQWTDRKTNYHRAPRIHAFGWMSGFLVFCWMLIAFQCEVSTPFSTVLRMKPKPAFVLF